MYITESERIEKILESGAKSGMTLEQIIRTEVDDWLWSEKRRSMVQGERYYRNEIPRKEGGLINGFLRKLVKQKTDYLLSRPFSIRTQDARYAEILSTILDKSFYRTIKRLGKEAVNKGVAWLQVYFADDGIAFQVIPSEEVIPLWADAAHTKLDAVIRVYERIEYAGMVRKTVRHVEYYDLNGVRRYVDSDGGFMPDIEAGETGSHFEIDGQGYNWERPPFVAFKYNDDEMPLLNSVKTLVDDYDAQKSVISKLLLDIPNFTYVIKNYGGADVREFLNELQSSRAIRVDEDGGVDKLSADIDITAYDTYQQQARKDIYEFGRGIDTQAVDLGNASGEALKFRYADLDGDCNDLETEFSGGMQDLLWFINQYLLIAGRGDFTNAEADFIFSRDIIINEAEAINECAQSKDIISDATIIANHPWVTDAEEEIGRLRAEQVEKREQQQVAFGMVSNTPPGDEDEE